MQIFLILGLISTSLMFTQNANAWRETGHFTVCEIAYRNLNTKAKIKVNNIAGLNFPAQCTWPDIIRRHPDYEYTKAWHVMDRDDENDYLLKDKILGKKFLAGDALQALVRVTQTLKGSAPLEDQKFALRFLGHLVGDIHQPLHVGKEKDAGGNQIKVEWFGQIGFKYSEILKYQDEFENAGEVYIDESTKEKVVKISDQETTTISLHKIWDLHLIEKFIELNGLPVGKGYDQYSYKEYAAKIEHGQVDKDTLKLLQDSTFYDWFLESKYFRSFAYDTNGGKLGQDYYEKVIEVANYRLLLGGLRLAGVLNRLLGGEATPAGLKKDQLLLEEIISEAQTSAKNKVVPPAALARFQAAEKQLKLSGITKLLCSEKNLHALYSKKEKENRKPAFFYDDYKNFQRAMYQKLTGKEFSLSVCKPL